MSKELPKRKGVIKNLQKFDATFFGIHQRQVLAMDPQGRIIIECAFEAVLDAGFNPQELRGTNTGCFSALCFSEAEKSFLFDMVTIDGFNLSGFAHLLCLLTEFRCYSFAFVATDAAERCLRTACPTAWG